MTNQQTAAPLAEREGSAAFDASRPIRLLFSRDGARWIRVRYPSDEQWTAYLLEHVVVTKMYGRGKHRPVIDRQRTRAAAIALLNAVRIDGVGELNGQTAKDVIDKLGQCRVCSLQFADASFRVEAEVVGGLCTVHILRKPYEIHELSQAIAKLPR